MDQKITPGTTSTTIKPGAARPRRRRLKESKPKTLPPPAWPNTSPLSNRSRPFAIDALADNDEIRKLFGDTPEDSFIGLRMAVQHTITFACYYAHKARARSFPYDMTRRTIRVLQELSEARRFRELQRTRLIMDQPPQCLNEHIPQDDYREVFRLYGEVKDLIDAAIFNDDQHTNTQTRAACSALAAKLQQISPLNSGRPTDHLKAEFVRAAREAWLQATFKEAERRRGGLFEEFVYLAWETARELHKDRGDKNPFAPSESVGFARFIEQGKLCEKIAPP